MYAGSYCGGYGKSGGYSGGYVSTSGCTSYHTGEYRNSSIDLLVDGAQHTLTISEANIPAQYTQNLYLTNTKQDYFAIEPFLTNAQETEFVNDAKTIEEPCKQAFRLTTGKELPKNIAINLCTEEELKKIHLQQGGKWSKGIQGFSINKGPKRISEIFVKKDFLDKVMITLGHEMGHVIAQTLPDARDEEAKAFAFSIAWMQTIVQNNIAGLTNAINPMPAKNGVHDAGFEFVNEEISKQQTSAFNIFRQVCEGILSITQRLEQIIIT